MIVSTEEFNKAYECYFEKQVKPYTTASLSSIHDQYLSSKEDGLFDENNKYIMGFYMMTPIKVSVQKIIISHDGKVELPEFLNDYI